MIDDELRRQLADAVAKAYAAAKAYAVAKAYAAAKAHAAAEAAPDGEDLRLLAQALLAESDPDLDCQACRDLLPEYVEAESLGLDAAGRYPDVRAHLLLCDDCQPEYLAQLDLARRLARDELPAPPSRPAPDLAFLRPARPPAPVPADPAAWWTRLRPSLAGVNEIWVRFAPQGAFQPAQILEDRSFETDWQQGLERRRLFETALPQVPEGSLSVVAVRQEGAETCELRVRVDSRQWSPARRPVRLYYAGGMRQARTDDQGLVCFAGVPVAALPDLEIEIPDVAI
jgi:hypothetical protein